ncbi:MAG: ribose 5-phosphate isomerase B [archaeon]
MEIGKILIASDHGGYALKEKLKPYLSELGYKYEDLGCHSEKSVDYPDYAKKVAAQVLETNGLGILICGTGIGMSISANKISGVRAALCYNDYTARMSREHNNANILCMGGRVLETKQAKRILKIWLETPFSGDERHKRRIEKVNCI